MLTGNPLRRSAPPHSIDIEGVRVDADDDAVLYVSWCYFWACRHGDLSHVAGIPVVTAVRASRFGIDVLSADVPRDVYERLCEAVGEVEAQIEVMARRAS